MGGGRSGVGLNFDPRWRDTIRDSDKSTRIFLVIHWHKSISVNDKQKNDMICGPNINPKFFFFKKRHFIIQIKPPDGISLMNKHYQGNWNKFPQITFFVFVS